MTWSDPHILFVVSAYGVALLGVLGMVVFNLYHFVKVRKTESQD